MARRIAQRMAAHCSFFRSSTSIIPGRFAYRIPQRMAADCSFLHSSTAFTTVLAPYCLTDGSLDRFFFCSSTAFPTVCMLYCSAYGTTARLWVHSYLLLVDDFANVPRAVDCSPDRSFFRSSTAFTTVYVPYCSADGSGLLILPLVNGFHNGSRAVLLSGWQRIAHSSARQRPSQRFSRRIAQRMAADCSFFRSSTAFATLCAPYYSADGSADGITARYWVHSFLPLVDDFANFLRAVDCSPYRSFLRSSAASTRVYMPDCSADSSADRRFFGSLTAIFSRRFAYHFARRMAHQIAPYSCSSTV